MKKLITKCILLAAIVCAVLIANDIGNRCIEAREYQAEQYTEKKFTHVPDHIQICNFGSSHGDYGFDYRDIRGYTTFYFALTSQTLSYDDRILHQYEGHLADGGIMFIPVSYFSLGSNEEIQPDFESKNDRYYHFLKTQYIKHLRIRKYLEINLIGSPVILHAADEGISGSYAAPSDFNFEQDAEAAFARHEPGIYKVRKEELNALLDMISVCHKHDIRPILITVPYRHEYNAQFPISFYKRFHAEINRICRESDAEYYDYSHDLKFVNSDKYFMNGDHLCAEGAVVFTDILMKEVVEKNTDEK